MQFVIMQINDSEYQRRWEMLEIGRSMARYSGDNFSLFFSTISLYKYMDSVLIHRSS